MTVCSFCKDNEADTIWEAGGAHEFRVSGNAIYYYDERYGWEGMAINFCPMCGRCLPRKGEHHE